MDSGDGAHWRAVSADDGEWYGGEFEGGLVDGGEVGKVFDDEEVVA